MTTTIEERVTVLEGKMESLEANPQPGQNQAFSDRLAEIQGTLDRVRKAQTKQQATLDLHTGQFEKVTGKLTTMSLNLASLQYEMEQFKTGVTGKLTRLDDDVTAIRDNVTVIEVNLTEFKEEVEAHVNGLKTDVNELKTDMAEVKTDVTGLKTDVNGLKTDMADVKGTLAEILRRLPKAA